MGNRGSNQRAKKGERIERDDAVEREIGLGGRLGRTEGETGFPLRKSVRGS